MKEKNEDVQQWLSEYSNPRTQNTMRIRLSGFLKWFDGDIKDLIKLSSKECKHQILQYQSEMKASGKPNNSILSVITSVRALFKYLEKPLAFGRGRLVSLQEAQNKHSFSNGDLKTMFEVSDTRGKALIALGCSLGWAISDTMALQRSKVETMLERAKDNGDKFIFFKRARIKTNAKALGILNPLAIEWLTKWLKIHKGSKLFDITDSQINRALQDIAKESGIKLLGKVSFHCFRGWVFSSLVKSGFSEFASKYVVGKTIPLSDATYLSLEEDIKEKYTEAYEKYFNISQTNNSKKSLALEQENREQRTMIKTLISKVERMEKGLSLITNDMTLLMQDYTARRGPQRTKPKS